jgi:hypothetical protein
MRAGFSHTSLSQTSRRQASFRQAWLWKAGRAGLLALAVSAACSSPKPADSPEAAAPGAAGAAEAEVLPELTPVPPPENIVGVATLRTPAHTLDTALGWTGLGLDFRMFLSSGAGAAILPVLDLEAPVDAVMTLDPKVKNRPRVLFAASIGLTSREAALEAFQSLEFPVEFVEPGIHSVRPNAKTLCFVAPALGKAKARLVCGDDRESVEQLSPYLTRGKPSDATGDADLHVELRGEPAWRQFGDKARLLELTIPMLLGEVSIGNPEFDTALRDGATALVDELILSLGELRDLRLDARLHDDPNAAATNELDVEVQLSFNAQRSLMARALADREGRAGVAPDTFWKLPVDATQAVYYSVGNPTLTEGAVNVLERLFESGLGHLGASANVKRAWPAAFKQAMDVSGPIVSARGNIPKEALPAALDAREQLRAELGYAVVGVEDPESRYGAWFQRTLELYEDVALRKSLAAKYGLDPAKLPKAQTKKGPARLREAKTYELGLPAALFSEALAERGVDPKQLAPIPIVLISCREGNYTWFGLSSYGSVLEQKLGAVLTASAPEGTLATRAGLERLRRESSNVAGFQTLAGLASGPSFGDRSIATHLAPFADNQVPMLIRARGLSTGAAGPGPTGSLQLRVPAALFRDIAMALASKR